MIHDLLVLGDQHISILHPQTVKGAEWVANNVAFDPMHLPPSELLRRYNNERSALIDKTILEELSLEESNRLNDLQLLVRRLVKQLISDNRIYIPVEGNLIQDICTAALADNITIEKNGMQMYSESDTLYLKEIK